MNDFEINIVIILLVGAMGWVIFGPMEASPGWGALAIGIWIILIGYVGGKIASK